MVNRNRRMMRIDDEIKKCLAEILELKKDDLKIERNFVVSITKVETTKDLQWCKVYISVLCPGPVNTNFDNVANVKFSLKGLSSEYVAKYGIDQMLKGKRIIIPGLFMKIACFGTKILPANLMLKLAYNQQKSKDK